MENNNYTEPFNIEKNSKKIYRKALLVITIIVLIIFFMSWDNKQGFDEDKIISETELTEVKGIVSNKLKISTGKGGSSLTIKLDNYPRINFQIHNFFDAFSANSFVEDVKTGDSVFIKILIYEYHTKITKTKKIRISEWLSNANNITPYEIKSKEYYYMTLAEANKSWEHDSQFGSFMSYYLLGIAGFLGLLYVVLKWTGVSKLIKRWWNEAHANQ